MSITIDRKTTPESFGTASVTTPEQPFTRISTVYAAKSPDEDEDDEDEDDEEEEEDDDEPWEEVEDDDEEDDDDWDDEDDDWEEEEDLEEDDDDWDDDDDDDWERRRRRRGRGRRVVVASGLDSVPQLKQPRQGVQQSMRDAFSRFVAQRFQGRVQQLVHQPVERLADFVLCALVQVRQPIHEPPQFFFLGLVPSVAQLLDHRAGCPVIHLGHETARLLLDDPLGGGQFLVAQQAVVLAGRLEVVDRIEVDVRAVADGRIEIARHGQVENEQRPLPPRGVDGAEFVEGHDGLSRARRADDQVGRGQRGVQFLPGPRLALPLARPAGRPARSSD